MHKSPPDTTLLGTIVCSSCPRRDAISVSPCTIPSQYYFLVEHGLLQRPPTGCHLCLPMHKSLAGITFLGTIVCSTLPRPDAISVSPCINHPPVLLFWRPLSALVSRNGMPSLSPHTQIPSRYYLFGNHCLLYFPPTGCHLHVPMHKSSLDSLNDISVSPCTNPQPILPFW